MKKKILIVICVIISIIFLSASIITILGFKYISSEIKADENDYLEISHTIAYGLENFIEGGDTEDLACVAADIYQMSKASYSAGNLVSDANKEILQNLVGILEYDRSILSEETQRLKKAFELIAENGENIDYAYAQIQIAITNCGF